MGHTALSTRRSDAQTQGALRRGRPPKAPGRSSLRDLSGRRNPRLRAHDRVQSNRRVFTRTPRRATHLDLRAATRGARPREAIPRRRIRRGVPERPPYLISSPTDRAWLPLYFVYGTKKVLRTLAAFKREARDAKSLHKSAFAQAEKLANRWSPGIVPHHRPEL